jgi:hypothetical protein
MEDFQLSIGQAGKRGMKARAGRFIAATAAIYHESSLFTAQRICLRASRGHAPNRSQ